MQFRLFAVCLIFQGIGAAALGAETKRSMTVEDLFAIRRVSDPQISPDGRHVVYVVTDVDLAQNSMTSSLWLVDSRRETTPRQLTTVRKSDSHPRWSPDGKRILFESNRSGSNQLWVLDLERGGEARPLTSLATEAGTGVWSPDGKWIAFVSAVYPEYSTKPFRESDALNRQRIEAMAKSPVKARVFTKLFFRHWNSYVEDKRQHLFVVSAEGGDPRDVTPGDRDAYPTSSTFSAGNDFCFSPDSSHLVFTAPPAKHEAWSTNYDICRVSVTNTSTDWETLTAHNLAADNGPAFSPDGTWLAYRAQKTPGNEADYWDLMVVKCSPSGKPQGAPRPFSRTLGGKPLDTDIGEFVWAGNDAVLFTADWHGVRGIFHWHLMKSTEVSRRQSTGTATNLTATSDGTQMAFLGSTMAAPPEAYVGSAKSNRPNDSVNVSQANRRLLADLALPLPESVTVPGDGGTPMQMWILKPPGFDAAKKWPLVYIVHGGPQVAMNDGWSFRWNPEVWAAQGYVIALPNPRGSPGFGRQYLAEISGDWGGKCYRDLMAGADYLEKLPYVDRDRMVAAGASFGGYMMCWFQGNTTRFKTLITHCGVYNNESMYGTTEELWFDEWEHGDGKPLWEARKLYRKHSPHLKAANFKTPMLIIHNDLDFRVPVGQGIELFTTLQRLGVPSKFINFPDEGHWVLKPANSAYWHREIFAWIKQYAPPGGR